jgi:hypothetical protein
LRFIFTGGLANPVIVIELLDEELFAIVQEELL